MRALICPHEILKKVKLNVFNLFSSEWEVSFLALCDEKKDVSLMRKLKSKAVRASFQRRGGSAHFISSNNLSIIFRITNFLLMDKMSFFVLNLIGDDELCEISDDNLGVEFVNDLIDGDGRCHIEWYKRFFCCWNYFEAVLCNLGDLMYLSSKT